MSKQKNQNDDNSVGGGAGSDDTKSKCSNSPIKKLNFNKIIQLVKRRVQLKSDAVKGWCVVDLGNKNDVAGIFKKNGEFHVLDLGQNSGDKTMNVIGAIIDVEPSTKEEGLWEPTVFMGPEAIDELTGHRFNVNDALDPNERPFSRRNIYSRIKTWVNYKNPRNLKQHNDSHGTQLRFHKCKSEEKIICMDYKPMYDADKFGSKTNKKKSCPVSLKSLLAKRLNHVKDQMYSQMCLSYGGGDDVKENEMKLFITHPTDELNSGYIKTIREVAVEIGFNEIRFVDEAFASCVNYMGDIDDEGEKKAVIVFDIGGGTADVIGCSMEMDSVIPIVKQSVVGCAGDDVNVKIKEWLLKKIKQRKSPEDIFGDYIDQLDTEIERVKKVFGHNKRKKSVSIIFKYKDGKDDKVTLTRDDLTNILNRHFISTINKTIGIVADKVKKVMGVDNIDLGIYTGGGSKFSLLIDSLQPFATEIKRDPGHLNVITGASLHLMTTLVRDMYEKEELGKKCSTVTIETLDSGIIPLISINNKKRKINEITDKSNGNVSKKKKKKNNDESNEPDDIELKEIDNQLKPQILKKAPIPTVTTSAIKLVYHKDHEYNRFFKNVCDEYTNIGDITTEYGFNFEPMKNNGKIIMEDQIIVYPFYEGRSVDDMSFVHIGQVELKYPFEPLEHFKNKKKAYENQFKYFLRFKILSKTRVNIEFHCGSEDNRKIYEATLDFKNPIQLITSEGKKLNPLNIADDRLITAHVNAEMKKLGIKKVIPKLLQ